jgi:hypothetical protein
MSNNIQDETIPMAYSRFLDIWRDKQGDIINCSSGNIFEFCEEVEDINKYNSNQIRNTMKQSHRSNDQCCIKKRKQTKKFETANVISL